MSQRGQRDSNAFDFAGASLPVFNGHTRAAITTANSTACIVNITGYQPQPEMGARPAWFQPALGTVARGAQQYRHRPMTVLAFSWQHQHASFRGTSYSK